jgi:hypothetical protein
MKDKRIQIKASAIALLLLLPCSLFSRSEKNIREEVREVIGHTVLFNMRFLDCQDVDFTMSSILITFSKAGKIQKIILSALPQCLAAVESKINEDLKRNLEAIGLTKKDFSNKFIVAVLTFRKVGNPQKFNVSFENTFSQIDEELLSGKEVKYLFSISIGVHPPFIKKVYPSIKNLVCLK